MIMVTSYDREDMLMAAEEAGIDEVLIKPVSPSVLFDDVVRILGGAPQGHLSMGDEPSGSFAKLATIRGARILLVEDNELNQEVALAMLQEAGMVVDLAENGQVALNRLAADSYDLVLMDMQMPVMDGLTSTAEIRKQPSLSALPIVAMTANAMQRDRDRCLAAGMNDHVAKPIEPEDLWKALLKWVKPGKSGRLVVPVPRDLPEEQELPSDIDGLDMVSGLRRVLGKKHVYLSMLHRYVEGQKSALFDIFNAILRDDPPMAERLAHTLKGASGTIGANGVQKLAAELEDAIKHHRPREELEAHIAALRFPLNTLVAQLGQRLPAERVKVTDVVDFARLKQVCAKLMELLREGDSEAVDVFDGSTDLLRTAFPVEHPAMAVAIRAFDFPATLASLRTAARQLLVEPSR
jgi:two-component system sensor histidine kinase/response regulator